MDNAKTADVDDVKVINVDNDENRKVITVKIINICNVSYVGR